MGDYVPLNNYQGIDLKDKPRRLTDEEILYIVDHLPYSLAADDESAELSRQCTIEWLQDSLSGLVICPSAIPELAEGITFQHKKSLITPGTPVGITAAEAVGGTTTQMVLNSVAPWEQILFQDSFGKGHIVKIGEWIDALLMVDPSKITHIPENRTEYFELPYPVKIATCDMDGKTSWERVTAVTRHLPVGDLVKIKTRSGREGTATQAKSFLTWDEDEEQLVITEGKDIRVGDKLPIAANLPEPPFVYQEIDFRKYLSPKEWLYGSEMKKVYEDYKAYDVPGKQKFWTIEDRLQNIPYARGDSVLKACRDLDTGAMIDGYIYPKSRGGSTATRIPEKIKLTREFGQFIGLYLAEGWATDTFVGISNNAVEIQNLVYRWCDSIGVTYHIVVKETRMGKSSDIKIHSVLLARWLKMWCGTGSAKKIMPDEILFGNREFIIGVLDGYIAGDGTVNKEDGAIKVGSVSLPLIMGTNFLCSRLGIFGKISGLQQKKNNVGSKVILYMNTFDIRNKNAQLWYDMIGSCHNAKKELMCIERKWKAGWGLPYTKHNGIMLDPIVSVEFIPPSQYVYDLTVEKTANFANLGGIFYRDTFHSSGSSKSASFGIDAMKDLIYAQKPKNKVCTIYYTNKQSTYEEILNSRREIVGSVVSDFVKDYHIDSPNDLQKYWWHDPYMANLLLENKGHPKIIPNSTKVMRLILDIPEMYKHHVTIKALADSLEREVPESIVTIHGPIGDGIIDVYSHPNIADEMLKKKPKAKARSKDKAKDITPVQKKAKIIPVPIDLVEVTYLETIVRPELSKIRVKGVSEIKDLVPVVVPVLGAVLLERKITQLDLPNNPFINNGGWLLFYNKPLMKRLGIIRQNISALCVNAGFKIIGGVNEYLAIVLPFDRFRGPFSEVVIQQDNGNKYIKLGEVQSFGDVLFKEINAVNIKRDGINWIETINKVGTILAHDEVQQVDSKYYKRVVNYIVVDNKYYELVTNQKIKELTPSEYINERIAEDKRERLNEIKRRTDKMLLSIESLDETKKRIILRRPIDVPKSALIVSAEFCYSEVDGNNLVELLALPGIDKTRTICNSMVIITSTLGIEAARAYLIRALYNTISNTSSYVHPANILLIAEFITSRGQPHGATFTGISRQAVGHLSLATLGRAGGVFAENALHARKEDIRNVSASIAVGTRMTIGDGAFDIAQDITEDGIKKTIINNDLFTMFTRDDSFKGKRGDTQNTISVEEEIERAEAGLGGIAIGTIDYRKGEKETDLLQEFGKEIQTTKQPITPLKMVTSKQITSSDLVGLLNEIKTGIPFSDIKISPLTTSNIRTNKIISEGIVSPDNIIVREITGGIPQGLTRLLLSYNPDTQPTTINRGLPTVNIEQLTPLSLSQVVSVKNELNKHVIDMSTLPKS